jgi:hypothetical protein
MSVEVMRCFFLIRDESQWADMIGRLWIPGGFLVKNAVFGMTRASLSIPAYAILMLTQLLISSVFHQRIQQLLRSRPVPRRVYG